MNYLETYDYNQHIINISRSTGSKRTDDQLKILKEWIEKNSKKNSIVNTFLQNCTVEEGIEFCRGLEYCTFKPGKLLITQGEMGDAYFIVLSGECNIYVNKYLVKGDIANEKRSGGLGTLVDTVSIGRDFGEYSLISSEPRAASIKSETFTECLVCYQQHFQKCLEKHAQNRVVGVIKEARQFPIFKGVSLAYLKQIFNRFNRIQVPCNTILQTHHQKIETILLIAKGKYREYIEVKDHNNKIRKKFISESIDGKGMVGSYYAITHKRPKTNIMTTTPCECLAISKKHFLSSITYEMEQNIRSVGKEKDKLIKQSLHKFKKDVKYLHNYSKKAGLTELKFQGIYSRHGKWGKFEYKLSNNLIKKLHLAEPIRKSIMETYYRTSKQENEWKEIANNITKYTNNDDDDDDSDNYHVDYNNIQSSLNKKKYSFNNNSNVNNNDTIHHHNNQAYENMNNNKTKHWIHVPSIRNKKRPNTQRKRYRTTLKTRPKTSGGVGYSLKDIAALKSKYNDYNNSNKKFSDIIGSKNIPMALINTDDTNELHQIQKKIKEYHSNATTLLKSHSHKHFKHLMLSQFQNEYNNYNTDDIEPQQQRPYDMFKKLKSNIQSPNEEIKTVKKIFNQHRLDYIQRSLITDQTNINYPHTHLNKLKQIRTRKNKTMKVKKLRQCFTEKKLRTKHCRTQRNYNLYPSSKTSKTSYVAIRTQKL